MTVDDPSIFSSRLLCVGLPCLRPAEYKRLSKNQKNVSRSYGGSRCAKCVRDRIVRAFLVEEQKIVKKVLKTKSSKAAEKTVEKTATVAEKKATPAASAKKQK